jgi:hypothetical protein
MAVANQPALPLGASLEGVGRGLCARVLFNSADRPRKKLITKLDNLIYVFTFNSTSNAPKTMELRFPCASRSSNLPSILPSVAATSFWLVVALKIIDRRPFKAVVYLILISFSLLNLTPQRWDGVPPGAPCPARLCSNTPPTASADYRVDCCLTRSIGGHLRPRPHLSLYFLMGCVSTPQTRVPTAAPSNPMACALYGPIGSSGAISWWCRWPTMEGEGQSRWWVEWRRSCWLLCVLLCFLCPGLR